MPVPAIAAAALGSMATSAFSGALNIGSNLFQQDRSERQRLSNYIAAIRGAGGTPAAVIQGLTGTAAGSSGGFANTIPDLGSTLNQGISADASKVQSEAAKEEAAAASVRAETDRQLGLMRLKWDPQKYFADIQKSLAEAMNQTKEAFLHGSMKKYYDELTTDIQKVRPWKLAGLAQGLLNDMATYNKILQETRTSKAQENYLGAAAYQAETQGDLNKANTELTYSQTLNESLRGFRLQWENTLLSNGIDPNKPFWENTARLMYTNPGLFEKRLNMFVSSLNSLDGKLQENLGEHYKRNISIGVGLHYLNKIHQQNANARSYRFNNLLRSVSSFIPFAGGSSSVPVTDTKLPWYLDDGRFY